MLVAQNDLREIAVPPGSTREVRQHQDYYHISHCHPTPTVGCILLTVLTAPGSQDLKRNALRGGALALGFGTLGAILRAVSL